MYAFDEDNTIFQQAASFINHTNRSLFLTGKAGTGKTTFLKYIRQHSVKKTAVVAPTGVAAINAGGMTIHSFFQLPFGTYIPDHIPPAGSSFLHVYDKNQLLKQLRLRQTQRALIQSLETLIIDEVSMVRADVLDAVDAVLRSVRKQPAAPFGGLQILFIGDLFQLPPVVKNEEWELMSTHYESPFFFDAHAVRAATPVYLELKKIYRQRDNTFIALLQNIRNNCCTAADFDWLHGRYDPFFDASSQTGYITLTAHNHTASVINSTALDKLPGNVAEIPAVIQGDFPLHAYPAEEKLKLKEGAQVMFIKNDKGEEKRYYNGKIGTVACIDPEERKIWVSFPGEPGDMELEPETWKHIRYEYDREQDRIIEEELGTFQQYPVQLAWAVTIHKSQGLTFEKAVIDAGKSFAPGQVYVALSRLTNPEGLVLQSKIHPYNIKVDPRVQKFSESGAAAEEIHRLLQCAQMEYARLLLLRAYSWEDMETLFSNHYQSYASRTLPGKEKEVAWAGHLLDETGKQRETAEKFNLFLQSAFRQPDIDYFKIHRRNIAAVAWFSEELEKTIAAISLHIKEQSGRPRVKKYISDLHSLQSLAEQKKARISRSLFLTETLGSSASIPDAMQLFRERKPVQQHAPPAGSGKPAPGTSKNISLQLFKDGWSIEQIAAQRLLTVSTVENHLIAGISSGEIKPAALVSPEKNAIIRNLLLQHPEHTLKSLKEQLGDTFSYTEVKAAVAAAQALKALES